MLLDKVFFENKNMEGERLELAAKGTLYYLGRELTLKNCTLVLKLSARNLFIRDARFIDCAFEVKQELKNLQQWVRGSLKNCRFKGRLSSCDFGNWPEYWDGEEGAIEGCDFTEAQLDGCRFLGCDERTLRFPRWPCFTLLDPIGHAAELRAAPWPERFRRVIIDDLPNQPPRTRALTLFAPSEAKRYGTTPEALRAVIERFDCIFY